MARVVELASHDLRASWRGGGLVDMDANAVTAAIMAAARGLDVRLADHAVVMARVGKQTGTIDQAAGRGITPERYAAKLQRGVQTASVTGATNGRLLPDIWTGIVSIAQSRGRACTRRVGYVA